MKQIVLQTNIKREPGYLYYAGTNAMGNIILCKVKMAHGGRKKKINNKKKKREVKK